MADKRLEEHFEQGLFRSRWLMAPFYVGLVIALVVLLITFGKEVLVESSNVFTLQLEENKVVLWLLTLIDMSLAGNLTLMVVFAGSLARQIISFLPSRSFTNSPCPL